MSVERVTNGKNPKLSIVIPTIPESDHIRVCNILQEQEFDPDYETIIVNDGELDICEARNEGVQEADANLIAVTDDDTTPPSDWLESIWTEFEDENTVCIEGSVSGGINYKGKRQYVGCNLAFDRDAALSVGGFNSEYAGWRDDTEFGWRMEQQADGICRYSSAVHMVHKPRPRSEFDFQRETLLKESYPDVYEDVLEDGFVMRLWRLGQRIGAVPWINRIRDLR